MRRRLAAGLCFALSVAGTAPAGAQQPEAAFATVEPVPVPTTEVLMAVDFPDAMHGYAVGALGKILATTDGGATWREQPSGVDPYEELPEGPDPACVAYHDDVATGCAKALRGVSFVDAQHGWAVGSPDLLLSTDDGGRTWTSHKPPAIDQVPGEGPGDPGDTARATAWAFTDVAFADRQHGTVVGEGGTILSTSDGGATWTWNGDRRYGGLRSVSFADARHGQVVARGGNQRNPFVTLATADAGTTWQMTATSDPGPGRQNLDFRSVASVDARHGYVGSSAGQIMATRDGGQHWSLQRKDTTETFLAMAYAGPNSGLAVGYTQFTDQNKASLVATADGGETWVARLMPGDIAWDVAFATPTTAFVVGCGGQHPPETNKPCQQSLIARVTFPAQSDRSSGGGGGSIGVFVLVGAAVVVIAAGAVVIMRRWPARGH